MVFACTFIGVLVGLLIAVVIVKAYNTDNKFKSDYDERQEAIRGRGYKYASYTAWALLGLVACLSIGEVDIHMDNAVLAFAILAISLLVQTIHAVMNDAYFGSNNDRRKYIVFFIVIAAINLAGFAVRCTEGDLIVDGTVTWGAINGICGLIFVILGIALGIKNVINKREEEEE